MATDVNTSIIGILVLRAMTSKFKKTDQYFSGLWKNKHSNDIILDKFHNIIGKVPENVSKDKSSKKKSFTVCFDYTNTLVGYEHPPLIRTIITSFFFLISK